MNKTYSFKINNNTKKNNNKKQTKFFNKSFSEALNDTIFANVIKNNPWMAELFGTTPKDDDRIYVINNTKDTTYDYDEFLSALNYLANLDDYKDTYDYELIDGTPIKFFGNKVQIGYDLIPLNRTYTIDMFNALKPKTKKTIIDIYIKLNH